MATVPTDLHDALSRLRTEELVELAELASALEKRAHLAGPQTDNELWQWVNDHLRVDVPRVAVCDGHVAPFGFLADIYFERCLAAIAMANRGGAKTFLCAILHVLNGKFKPGVEMASVGAIEAQAQRCYAHVQKLLAVEGGVALPEDNSDIRTTIQSRTVWKNGSRLEVLGGSMNAVNGPHPQKVHFDEVELADPQVFDESRNMSQTANGIAAQDFITSTRKRAHGPMQHIIDEIQEAERLGDEPPYQLYSWCIFETAAQVENCQVARPELSEKEHCTCHKIVKGAWDDGTPRRFSDVCKGRLARSQGWIPIQDVHKTFRLDSQAVWEAQQECIRPSTEGLVLPNFNREIQGIRRFTPDPGNGPIYMGVDFGGTNPHAINWYQHLRVDLDVLGFYNEGKPNLRLPEGAIVAFDEIYIAEIGNGKLADMVVERERFWKQQFRGWHVSKRFPDPQAKAARLDWASHKPPLHTTFIATRDVKQHIIKIKELLEQKLFYVDVVRCPNFVQEAEAWRYPNKRSGMVDDPEIPVNDFDHTMAEWRYTVANIFQLQRRAARRRSGRPSSTGVPHATATILKEEAGRVRVEQRKGPGIPSPVSSRSRERTMP